MSPPIGPNCLATPYNSQRFWGKAARRQHDQEAQSVGNRPHSCDSESTLGKVAEGAQEEMNA